MPHSRMKTCQGLCILPCPNAMPLNILHNSKFTPPIEVVLSNLELCRSELPLTSYFNTVTPSLHG